MLRAVTSCRLGLVRDVKNLRRIKSGHFVSLFLFPQFYRRVLEPALKSIEEESLGREQYQKMSAKTGKK